MKQDIINQFKLPSYIKNKSFADASKLIENKFKDRLDKSSLDTKKELLQRLANAQEFIKLQEQESLAQDQVPMEQNQAFLGGMLGGAAGGAAGGVSGGLFGGMSDKTMGMIGGAGNALGTGMSAIKGDNSVIAGDPSDNQMIDKTKDTVAAAIGPMGQMFRGIQKAGQGIGDAVGGDVGAGIAGVFSPEEATLAGLKNKDFNVGQKLLSTVPGVGGIMAKKHQDEKLKEQAIKDTLSENLQHRGSDFAKGGKMNSYATGGPIDPPTKVNPFDFFRDFRNTVPTITEQDLRNLNQSIGNIGTKSPVTPDWQSTIQNSGVGAIKAYNDLMAENPEVVQQRLDQQAKERDLAEMDSIQKNPSTYLQPQRGYSEEIGLPGTVTYDSTNRKNVPLESIKNSGYNYQGDYKRVRSDNYDYDNPNEPIYDIPRSNLDQERVRETKRNYVPFPELTEYIDINELNNPVEDPVIELRDPAEIANEIETTGIEGADRYNTGNPLMDRLAMLEDLKSNPQSPDRIGPEATFRDKLSAALNGTGEKAGKFLKDNYADALRYSPVIANALQLKNLEKPEYERLNRLNNRYEPDYVDEAALTNKVSQAGANTRRALTEASGGDLGALRANLIGSQLAESRGISDALLQSENINRGENRARQEFNVNVDRTNLQQSNREGEINARNKGAYESNKSALIGSIGNDLGNIGREQRFKQMVEQSGLCYDSKGAYICSTGERASKEDVDKLQESKSTNENTYGGNMDRNALFTNYLDVIMKNKKK